MKKIISIIIIVVSLLSVTAIADETTLAFDVDGYSLEDLRIIKEQVDSRIAELERQWAIEHGDRTITFEESEITLFTNKTKKIKPIITRVIDDAPQKTTILWSTSDKSIAKVDSEGTVTAVAYGDATITATAKDNDCIFGSIVVHVVLPVSKVSAQEPEVTLLLNEDPSNAEMDLHVNISPDNAYYQTVTWKSSKETVVSVSDNGHIKGLMPGTSTITATSTEPVSNGATPKKATFTVTVVQAVKTIKLSDKELIIDKAKTKKLTATVSPDDATKKSVTWKSSNDAIATVAKDGTITAKSCGECDIICTATDGSNVSAKCHVIVKQLVTSIKLSESKIVLAVGSKKSITATITPTDATCKDVTWKSSDEKVATVEKGKIVAVNGGDCIITCSTTDGSEKQATVSVHVPTFSVSKNEYTVTSKKGQEIPINVNGNQKLSISYDSSYFEAWLSGNKIIITPLKAGTGSIKITNSKTKQDDVSIKIIIDHSAVYDTTSYPKASYKDILRYPSTYKGDRIHIYGKVLQKVTSGTKVILRVGTSGYGYYDSVFWVEYDTSTIRVSVIEDDYVTVYGKCTGAYTYTATMGNSITIPSMEAEKIVIGRKWD
jgi:uncharacterized protein YjdB